MWKAQKARFPHSHNHYCYCRFFAFLKHNFSFTPRRLWKPDPPRPFLPHRKLIHLRLALLAEHAGPPLSHPQSSTMLAILQLHTHLMTVVIVTFTAHVLPPIDKKMISITAKAPEPVRPAQSSWLGVHSSKLIAHYSSLIAHRSKKKSPASDSSDRRCNQRR